MKRFKWYTVFVPSGSALFFRSLKTRKFTSGSSSGFLPLTEDDSPTDFRFLWRSSVLAVRFDDFGNQTSHEMWSIEQLSIRFSQAGDILLLRVTDPPRSMREFFNFLEHLGGNGTSIQSLIFSSDQQEEILKKFDSFRLIGLRGVGSSSVHRIVARIELASKDGINIDKLPFLEKLRFNADQTSYEIMEDGLIGQITFMASGAVRVAGAVLPYIVAQLEDELLRARA